MKIHEKYLLRCLEIAKNGLGSTYPNPLVGCVIVHQDRIIGEGWHQKAGEAHAEVNAIASVKEERLLQEATIYVSLEPCSHYGKTPPCSDLIIAKGIKRVVVGSVDPFAKVAGKGIQKLMNAGCDVSIGVCEKESQFLNRRFFTFHQKKRPYILLKWAQTQDGFIAPVQQNERQPVWITNPESRQLVHRWRSEEQAILVGANTAVKDNPSLNTRLWKGKNPIRLLIDRHLKTPLHSNLFDGSVKTFVFTEKVKANSSNLFFETINFSKSPLHQICHFLYQQDIQSLIVEGGSYTLQQFIDAGLWDEARVFSGNKNFEKGIKSPTLSTEASKQVCYTGDVLNVYYHD